MNRVLITGGAGFVGSNLAVSLATRHPEWEVVALDNLYRRGSELNLPRLQEAGVEGANRVGKGGWFQAIDANKDGFVTPAEIDQVSAARFPKMDLNGDGFVDRIEAEKAGRRAMSK